MAGCSRALHVALCQVKPTVQVHCEGAPDDHTPHGQHRHDLGLRSSPIQRQQDVGSINLADLPLVSFSFLQLVPLLLTKITGQV